MPINKKKKILVVDDVKTNRRMLQNILEKNGFETNTAENGYDCIRSVLTQPPELILLDIEMPDISGIDVCRNLRNDSRVGPIPILFVTANTDDQTLSRAFAAGGNDFIRKPVNVVEVLKRVEANLQYIELIVAKRKGEELSNILAMNGTICHELNQPLQYIAGMSQVLLMDLKKGSDAFEKIEKMKVQIDRMDQIIKKLTRLNALDKRNYVGKTSIFALSE